MSSSDSDAPHAETERVTPTGAGRGTTRTLVVLGDSIAYGWGLPASFSYPALLDRWLSEGRTASDTWRVINAGVPGDTVLCAERRYARDVALWQADALLISLGLNDAALRRTRIDEQRERLWIARRNAAVRWSLRLDRLLKRCGRKKACAGQGEPLLEERWSKPRVQPHLFVRALGDLVSQAREQDLMVYLLSLPPLAWERVAADQAAWYRRYDGLIHEVAFSSGAPLIEVGGAPPLDQDVGYWQEDGIHLSAQGQAWLATCIADRLEPRPHRPGHGTAHGAA